MPILVLVNGSPGTGKTTLARRWEADHPLSVALDIDTIRGMVGGWRDDESNAGKLARNLSRSMIRTALSEGHDVLVPQLVANPEFIDSLAEIASSRGSSFLHVVLTAPVEVCVQRCAERENTTQFVDPDLNLSTTVAHWAKTIKQTVPCEAALINTDADVDDVYERFSSMVASHTDSSIAGTQG
jgi:predicted kinase